MANQVTYCVDTSGLVDWWVRYYPPANFVGLVKRMEALIDSERAVASREVLTELENQDDDLRKWAKRQRKFFVDSESEIQAVAKQLTDKYHDPGKPQKGIRGADSFVIALASLGPHIVVTAEHAGSKENPKIPFVCGEMRPKIEVVDFLGLIKLEKWKLV